MAGHGEEEFDEGDVWDVLQDQSSKDEAALPDFTPPPRRSRNRGGKNKQAAAVLRDDGEEDGGVRRRGRMPSSSTAPVAVPLWCSSRRGGGQGRDGDEDEDEDEEEGGEMLPPHEWLARKMERMSAAPAASSPAMASGRRKGREMRKFRDAVLPKTAFSEQ